MTRFAIRTHRGSGLGSSSAVIVTLIGLLEKFHKRPLTGHDIAQLAFDGERTDLGIQGGLQDQYAATFEGFNLIEFEADRVIVNPLRIPADVIHELEHNILLCHTGGAWASDRIIDDQSTLWKGRGRGGACRPADVPGNGRWR
jgi:D-glycero-alpha-D-manno-heptose-7-phosphate kinase